MADIVGTGDSEVLLGTAVDDSISALDGNDRIEGFEGNDSLSGGGQNDTINGGDGNDRIDGDANADILNGGGGLDTIEGGSGSDKLSGDGGNDRMFGGVGDDRLAGGDGNDRMDGGEGDDRVIGGDGSDAVQGGDGDDVLYGDNASDGNDAEGFADFFIFDKNDGTDKVFDFEVPFDTIALLDGMDDLSFVQGGGDNVIMTYGSTVVTFLDVGTFGAKDEDITADILTAGGAVDFTVVAITDVEDLF